MLVAVESRLYLGAIAQLGERLHGMQEVGGSIPPSSTRALSSGSPPPLAGEGVIAPQRQRRVRVKALAKPK